jgi:predicted NUDIX family NTP pyrophosphohydrolase
VTESAGILLFRRVAGRLEVLLVHPGGPFWKNKDAGAWTIPKGEIAAGEDPLACALREMTEETGYACSGPATPLPAVKQKGGKRVLAWAVEGDFDPATLVSNTFSMEWPPKSGRRATFPEVDRAEWFELERARDRINPAQASLLDFLLEAMNDSRSFHPT